MFCFFQPSLNLFGLLRTLPNFIFPIAMNNFYRQKMIFYTTKKCSKTLLDFRSKRLKGMLNWVMRAKKSVFCRQSTKCTESARGPEKIHWSPKWDNLNWTPLRSATWKGTITIFDLFFFCELNLYLKINLVKRYYLFVQSWVHNIFILLTSMAKFTVFKKNSGFKHPLFCCLLSI